MKILILTTQFYQLGGAERLAVELAADLNRRSVHADILSMYTEDLPGTSEAKRVLLAKGIPSVQFLGLRVHPSLPSLIPAMFRLRKLVKNGKYDVIETTTVPAGILAAWSLRGLSTRHVVGLHAIFRRDRDSSIMHWIWLHSVRWNRYVRYYAISDFAAELWRIYSGTVPGRTRRVYNSVPDSSFDGTPDRKSLTRELEIPYDRRLVAYVGRLTSPKGLDTLLDALGPIMEENDLHFLLAGAPDLSCPGSAKMLQYLQQQIETHGWHARVTFLGFRADIPRLLASCDLMVLPTRTEAFGLALVEAMAVGTPVVATNVDAIPEILAGTDCLMVEPDNSDALRKAILATLDRSAADAASARQKGLDRANQFRPSRRTDAMITLYKDVLSGRL